MAAKEKEIVDELKVVDETTEQAGEKVSGDDIVKFESNGKSKHMPKDQIYDVTKDEAQILIDKKYGKIIE